MKFGTWLKPIYTTKRETKEDVQEVDEPLSMVGRMFHAPHFNWCIVTLIGCKTRINVELIKEGITKTILMHPCMSSKLAFDPREPGKPTGWIQTKVNIDDHIIVPSLDHKEIDSPNELVNNYVTNLTQTPMDLTKPLWEIHILNIETKDANAIALLRMHHCMGDGVTLTSVILNTRNTSNTNALLPTFSIENNMKKLRETNGLFWLFNCVLWLFFVLRLLWNTLVDFYLFVATLLFLKDSKTPLKGYHGIEKAPKTFVYRTLSLDDIKLVNNVMSVTVNDVVLGIAQAGLSRYLNKKYGESNKGDEKGQQNNLPKHMLVRTTLLVNTRPTYKLEDLDKQMEEENSKKKWQWSNSIGYILLPFDITLRDDPLDYIRSAKAIIDKKKNSLEALLTYLCTKFFLKTLGLGATSALTYKVLRNTTLAFSNIVGPNEEITLYGHPITFLASSVYGHPQALTIHFQSYMNIMTLVVGVDQMVIPEPNKLCDDIEDSLELIKQAFAKKKVFRI